MRTLAALALILTVGTAHAPARAADLSGEWIGGRHAEPLVLFDYEPGVVLRAYWLAPLGGRHFFPATGRRPRFGRQENFARKTKFVRAPSFHQEWSTFPVDLIDQRPVIQPLVQPSRGFDSRPADETFSK